MATYISEVLIGALTDGIDFCRGKLDRTVVTAAAGAALLTFMSISTPMRTYEERHPAGNAALFWRLPWLAVYVVIIRYAPFSETRRIIDAP